MDRSSLIVVVMPLMTLTALFMGIALPFIADSLARPPRVRVALTSQDGVGAAPTPCPPRKPGGHDAAPAEYLYVPCARGGHDGYSAGTRRWVQAVPIVRKTAQWIYYASDSWDRREAVVSPGCISRERFETDTRCRDDCPHGEDRCRHGYPAGVIPIPGDRHRPGPAAGRLFYATREAAEHDLYRGQRQRAERVAPRALLMRELRRAMADAHPDRGGTAEEFMQARRRYQTALG